MKHSSQNRLLIPALIRPEFCHPHFLFPEAGFFMTSMTLPLQPLNLVKTTPHPSIQSRKPMSLHFGTIQIIGKFVQSRITTPTRPTRHQKIPRCWLAKSLTMLYQGMADSMQTPHSLKNHQHGLPPITLRLPSTTQRLQ